MAERSKLSFLKRAESIPRPKIVPNADVSLLVESQLDALRADAYEIFLAPYDAESTELSRYNGDEKQAKHWSSGQLLVEIPRLKQASADARVMLLPISGSYVYLQAEGKNMIKVLQEECVDPCLGLKLSKEYEQVIIRLPVDEHHEKRMKKLAQICHGLGCALNPVGPKLPILLAGFPFGHGNAASVQRPVRTSVVEISHAVDCTYRAGIEWARTTRLGFKPD